jgi:CTP synthase (UTP-ammonia lyase)
MHQKRSRECALGYDLPMRGPIAVVGDYQPNNETHTSVATAVQAASRDTEVEWVATTDANDLSWAGGVWIAPGGPYRSFEGALDAIRWARTNNVPLFGTCAGFQHAVIEFARNVVGLDDAHHAEYETDASLLVVDALACSLAGETMDVSFVDGTKAHAAYGRLQATERYYCRFGLNKTYTPALLEHGLIISGTDVEGEPRIVELPSHPFFVVTLFVPQTHPEQPHPLISAFVDQVGASGYSLGSRSVGSSS